MKQTAVEWLIQEIHKNIEFIPVSMQEQAKEMEKEQIIDSYVTGLIDPLIMKNYKGLSVDIVRIELKKQAAIYYNETYKNETK